MRPAGICGVHNICMGHAVEDELHGVFRFLLTGDQAYMWHLGGAFVLAILFLGGRVCKQGGELQPPCSLLFIVLLQTQGSP
jgi:hypothetical protein